MADIAGGLTGPPLAVDGRAPSPPGSATGTGAPAAALGADTAPIMDELGLAPAGAAGDASPAGLDRVVDGSWEQGRAVGTVS